MAASQRFTIALAGNPNVGKSTIFNALTGSRQHVGNWPGKTVEKKEGSILIDGQECFVIDLPGTYSLTAYSVEEVISRDYLLDERPNAVVAVVDASNLERNLYLVTQLLELEIPVIVALNMSDIADKRGLKIDPVTLSRRLGGVPVIRTVGGREESIDRLKQAIYQLADGAQVRANVVHYGDDLEKEVNALRERIESEPELAAMYATRWLAVKLLENDEDLFNRLRERGYTSLVAAAETAIEQIEESTGEEAETLLTDRRYMFISEVVRGILERSSSGAETLSDRVDHIVTHRFWGLPIFLFLMWTVFQFTAHASAPFLEFIEYFFEGPATNWTMAILGTVGLSETWIESLLIDGVIAGVGGVLVFVPVLFSLYLALAVLEDSGYMARSAIVMDRFMNALGLHGKAFLPLLVGFGCTVPAIYATRTLDNEADRKITGFLATFMSCGARLPVYVVFGAAFFGANAGNLIFGMYLAGIVVAVLTSLLLTRVFFHNRVIAPLVIELPPYRVPTAVNMWRDIGRRIGQFIRNAGTIILAAVVVLWFLLSIPANGDVRQFNEVELQDSAFGSMSRMLAPVLEPAGFGTWEASGSLITGLIAKEVVIATMNQIYVGEVEEETEPTTFVEDLSNIGQGLAETIALTGQEIINIVPRTVNLIPGINVGEASFFGEEEEESFTALESSLRNAFTPLSAVAFNVFILLYIPCMATVGAMRQEFGTRWMLYQSAYTLLVAWMAAVLVYQVGTFLGLG